MRRSSFRYATVSAAAWYPEAPTLPIGVLDELEVVFCEKARSGDVAAGTLLVKISERRSSLSDLNSPPGFSVNAVHASPQHQETSTARIEKVLAELKLETERAKAASDHDDDHDGIRPRALMRKALAGSYRVTLRKEDNRHRVGTRTFEFTMHKR